MHQKQASVLHPSSSHPLLPLNLLCNERNDGITRCEMKRQTRLLLLLLLLILLLILFFPLIYPSRSITGPCLDCSLSTLCNKLPFVKFGPSLTSSSGPCPCPGRFLFPFELPGGA